jgi:hypothetical protein
LQPCDKLLHHAFHRPAVREWLPSLIALAFLLGHRSLHLLIVAERLDGGFSLPAQQKSLRRRILEMSLQDISQPGAWFDGFESF